MSSTPIAETSADRLSTALDLTPRSKSPFAQLMSDSLVIGWRNLLRVPRQIDWLVGVTIMPLMFLLMFRYIFAGTVQMTLPQGVSAVNYLVVGILVQGIVFSGMNTGYGLAQDAKEGLMDRFRSLPMQHLAVVMGRIVADMAIAIFTTIITVLVAFAVGFRPTAGVGEWLAAIGIMLLTAFVFCWLGAVIGLALKTVEAVSSIGFSAIMPLTFISSAFISTDFLPSWLQGFAANQPFSLSVNATRGLLNGYPDVGNTAWLTVVWWIGTLIVVVPLTYWMFKKRGES
ncbi:MAG: ABC transporter permease [Thermomicrobiales bacterium]|nr:ABC transporter permease [Thermomicrobiales bacterium]